jgi:hypothetical protein
MTVLIVLAVLWVLVMAFTLCGLCMAAGAADDEIDREMRDRS